MQWDVLPECPESEDDGTVFNAENFWKLFSFYCWQGENNWNQSCTVYCLIFILAGLATLLNEPYLIYLEALDFFFSWAGYSIKLFYIAIVSSIYSLFLICDQENPRKDSLLTKIGYFVDFWKTHLTSNSYLLYAKIPSLPSFSFSTTSIIHRNRANNRSIETGQLK